MKYDGYQRGFVSMVDIFSKKDFATHKVPVINSENQQLAEESHEPIIKKISKNLNCTLLLQYLGSDSTDTQSIRKHNKGNRFLLCVIDAFSKYAPVFPLKDKKEILITKAFQKICNKSSHKSNKIFNTSYNLLYQSLCPHFECCLQASDTVSWKTRR